MLRREIGGSGSTGIGRGPLAAAAVPVALILIDSALVVGVVADGDNCDTDCFAGLSVLLFSPSVRPLTATGYGSEGGSPTVVAVVVALLVVLVLTAIWWGLLGAAIQRRMAASRVPWPKALLLYGGALLVTVYMKVLIDQVDDATGPLLSVPSEALMLLCFVWLLVRSGAARR